MRLTGGVYLERGFAAGLPELGRPTNPPAGMSGHTYEYLTTVYWPDVDDRRQSAVYQLRWPSALARWQISLLSCVDGQHALPSSDNGSQR